jgi:hypothetical protein
VLKRVLLFFLFTTFAGTAIAQDAPAQPSTPQTTTPQTSTPPATAKPASEQTDSSSQNEAEEPISNKPPRIIIFAGYSYENAGYLLGTRSNLNGYEASVEGFHLRPHLSFVGDASAHYGWNVFPISCVTVGIVCTPNPPNSRAHQYNFMGGPQWRFFGPHARFQPFVHVLGGYGRVTMITPGFFQGSWAWELAAGGGVDYPWRGPFSWRAQADYLRNNFFNDGQNQIRLSLGLVFHF